MIAPLRSRSLAGESARGARVQEGRSKVGGYICTRCTPGEHSSLSRTRRKLCTRGRVHTRAPTSSHPSSRTILSSTLVPPLFPPTLVRSAFFHLSVSPFPPPTANSSTFPPCLFLCPRSPSLLLFPFLLPLFTSLFALSPFSSSESGLIHWKLFICLIATRRPGSSTLRGGNLRHPSTPFDADSYP